MTYKDLREIREDILDEINNEFNVISIEHYSLAEMRIQNILLAGIVKGDVRKEKASWKRKF